MLRMLEVIKRTNKIHCLVVRSGISTSITNCELWEKKEIAERLRAVRDNIRTTVLLYTHGNCRKNLQNNVRKMERLEHNDLEPPTKRRQSNSRKVDLGFKWKKHCFICTRICSDSTHSEPWSLCDLKRKDKPESTRDKILKFIHNKTDKRSLVIKRRVSSCSDLPAVDARYHVACLRKLDLDSYAISRNPTACRRELDTSSNFAKRGRPQNRMQADNFEKLCQWFERECNLYTAAELFEKMKEFANNPNDPNQLYASPQYLKNKLKERYGNQVFFSEFPGKSNVVCFNNNASEVLTDVWYEGRKSNAEEESQRINKTAAKLIIMEMRSCNPDSSTYPTNEVIGNMKSNKECMPLLLRTLLESLLNNTLRQASIGQSHCFRRTSTVCFASNVVRIIG